MREVAKLLNVATSTVYKLCAEGKLEHVRVSNAIRVAPGTVAEYVSGPHRWSASQFRGARRSRR